MSCQSTLDIGRNKPLGIWNLFAVDFESMTLANALAELESAIISGLSYCEFLLFIHKDKRNVPS